MTNTRNSKSTNRPTDDAKEMYSEGAVGNHLSQLFTGLQAHKSGMHLAQQWAERANRIGWANAGVDVAKLDDEIKSAGEDVDQSINLSGDTHVHFGSDALPKPQQPVQPQEPTAPQPTAPQPPPAQKPNGTPTWLKWALAAAIGASAAGPAITAYIMRPTDEPAGGSIFRFDTELPPWMEPENDTP